MVLNNRTDTFYWKQHFSIYKDRVVRFENVPQHDLLKKYLKKDPQKTCIEIGAFPGTILGYFAKEYHYQPTALDFLQDLNLIRANMQYNGINNCEIIQADFTEWVPAKLYDVVCSFGFIEHFECYTEIIKKHYDILKPGGLMIITVPVLHGLQLWIRQLLYKKKHYRKIIKSHNTKIMRLRELKRVVFGLLEAEKLEARYYRGMTIWFKMDQVTTRTWLIPLYKGLKFVEKVISLLNISHALISPEIIIIARKPH